MVFQNQQLKFTFWSCWFILGPTRSYWRPCHLKNVLWGATRTQAHTCGKPVYRSANLKKWVYTFTVGGLGGRLDSVEIKPTQHSQAEARLWLWLGWAWQYLNDLTMYLFNTVDLCNMISRKKKLLLLVKKHICTQNPKYDYEYLVLIFRISF